MRFFTPKPVTDHAVGYPVTDTVNEKTVHGDEKGVINGDAEPRAHSTEGSDTDAISADAQHGVQAMEATTKTWSRKSIIIAYVMIWFIYFMDALQQGMTNQLTPFVTSSFRLHTLTGTTGIFAYLIGGLFKLPLAKILDIWGRPQGYAVCLALLTLGLVMMAACQNVETYAAAQVFYWVGYNGLLYTLSIFVADTSALKARGLMFAYISSPFIITTWAAAPLAEAFYKGPGWRYAFATMSIVIPFMSLPLLWLFIHNYRKAKAAGLVPNLRSGRTFAQSAKYYFWQFDVIGLFLAVAGLAMFLLPFSIYTLQNDRWQAPVIYLLIVFGGLTLIAFGLWEKFWAPVKFMPFELLADRTILGACLLAMILFIQFYVWDSYFVSFLLVVNNLSMTHAGYIANIYSIGACLWGFVVGLVILFTGRFKPIALYFGVPFTILGVALMINFRQADVNIGYIVMCQIFIAFAGGTLVICQQVAAMAATTHQYIAVVLAVESMFSNIGGAIGGSIATAIWTGVFPAKVREFMPPDVPDMNVTMIIGDIVTQTMYPPGSPERNAINDAYGYAQRIMLISASCLLILAIVCVAVWRDIQVKDFKQVKGRVI